MGVQVCLAGGDDSLGFLVDEIVHDGQIMRREIPNHIDVVLEQAQIDPRGIVIVEIAQLTLIDQLADLLHRSGKEKRVVHHDLEVFLLGQFDQLFRLGGVGSKRLFEENVLAVFQGRLGQLEMRPDGSNDGHRINVGRTQDFIGVGSNLHARIGMPCHVFEPLGFCRIRQLPAPNRGLAGF